LPSLVEALEGGALLQYVVGDYHSSRGAVAEGDGVRPDVLVPETRADFVTGRDPVLAAAVQALSASPQTQPSGVQPSGVQPASGPGPVEVRP
jgi:carboxyl-terminal processing protease